MINLRLFSLTLALYSIRAQAAQICSPESCVNGHSSSSILFHDQSINTQLIPASYHLNSSPSLSSASITSQLNQSTSISGDTITLSKPPRPLSFTKAAYKGDYYVQSDQDGISSSWNTDGWKSLYLPDGWYGVIGDGMVLWGGVVDSVELPAGTTTKIKRSSSTTCQPSCSTNGICIPSNTSEGIAQCQCKTGWSGSQCDRCAPGYFGKDCTACQGDCTVWDDGLGGSGKCIGTTKNSTTCSCQHGTCTPSGDCQCSAGYTTNSTTSAFKCNTCLSGFYQTSNGDCSACPLGCQTCEVKKGSTDTITCLSCNIGLRLSGDPASCVSPGSCSDGTYWGNSTSTCSTCSPACETCSGPAASDCLKCSAPRMNFQGSCVGMDSRGICDTSLTGTQGVFIANLPKGKCDACAAGCLSCDVPNLSTSSFEPRCTACSDGFLMQNGKCVNKCEAGWFLDGKAERNGTCSQCSPSCTECLGSSTYCTKCPSSTFALSGSCTSTCPSTHIALNGTCTSCNSECWTCSTSPDTCTSCPSSRPVLQNGRCLEYCPKSSYYSPSSSSTTNSSSANNDICKACDWSCGSCIGPTSYQCTSCTDPYILKSGQCISAKCKNGFVFGFGLCLEDLVDEKNYNWIAGVIVPVLLAIIGAGAWWFIRNQRRRTKEDTRVFGRKLEDDIYLKERAARFGHFLGFNRVFVTHNEEGNGDIDRKKNRLKDLLLPHRRRSELNRDNIELSEKKLMDDYRQSIWESPPPPYNARASLLTPSSASEQNKVQMEGRNSSRLSMLGSPSMSSMGPNHKRKILDEIKKHQDYINQITDPDLSSSSSPSLPSSPSPSDSAIKTSNKAREQSGSYHWSDKYRHSSLFLLQPPPRAFSRLTEDDDKEVYRPQISSHSGSDTDFKDISLNEGSPGYWGRRDSIDLIDTETDLRALWPNTKSGSNGNNRKGEGWI